jgi:hypothetical protein
VNSTDNPSDDGAELPSWQPPPSPDHDDLEPDRPQGYGGPGQGPVGYGQVGYGQAEYGQGEYAQAGHPQQAYAPHGGFFQPGTGGYGVPQYAVPDHGSATTALVLGLVAVIGGFACCGIPLLLSPVAWYVGAKTKREIDESGGQLGGRDRAMAGFVLGIIGTALLVLAILGVVGTIAIGIAGGSSTATVY